MKFLLLISLATQMFALDIQKQLEQEYKHFNNKQKATLVRTFYTAQKFKYGYTMTAIAWQESHFGKYMINLSDPSCGVFHVMPQFIGKGSKSKWKQSRLCEQLIQDYDFSFSASLEKLKYFENYWKSKGVSKVWSHTVISYNLGFKYKKDSVYLKRIKEKIKFLKTKNEFKIK